MKSDLRKNRTDKTLQRWECLTPTSWRITMISLIIFVGASLAVWVLLSRAEHAGSRRGVDLALLCLLAAASAFDIRYQILPDALTLSLVGFGLFWNYWTEGQVVLPLIGAGAGFLVFYLIDKVWQSRTGNTGLGLGDAKLMAGAGALLGPLQIPFVILLSSAAALVFVVVSSLWKLERKKEGLIVFGPFICFGIWTVWTAGPLT